MTTIDTTLPRTETVFKDSITNTNIGYANTVAVIGKAKFANKGATIINSGADVYQLLGESSSDSPASNIVNELFQSRTDADTGEILYGAGKVLYVDVVQDKESGEAILKTIDEDDNEVDAIKVKFKTAGERTGYSLDITETGLNYDIILMKGAEIVDGETYYSVSPAELVNEIKLNSNVLDVELLGDFTEANNIFSLKPEVVTFSNGSDGTEPTDIKQATIDTLELIKYDVFDHIVLGLDLSQSDLYDSEFVKKLQKYFKERMKNGKFSFIYVVSEVADNTVASIKKAITNKKSITEEFFRIINTNLNTEDNLRSLMESASAYCGLVCAYPVYESTGNKVMSDVASLGVYLSPEQHTTLLKNGITTFARRELEGSVHRVVSAVTASNKFNANGSQSSLREEHVVRSMYYALNYFDLSNLVCSTGFDEATEDITSFLTQKKTELINAGVINDVEYEIVRDPQEPRHVIVKYKSFTVKGIVKVITNEVSYNINLA